MACLIGTDLHNTSRPRRPKSLTTTSNLRRMAQHRKVGRYGPSRSRTSESRAEIVVVVVVVQGDVKLAAGVLEGGQCGPILFSTSATLLPLTSLVIEPRLVAPVSTLSPL